MVIAIFIHSGIEALIALRDTGKPLDDTAKDLVYQQKDRLEETNGSEIAIPDTFDNSIHNPKQLKEIKIVLINELAATREMNVH
ncbi:hypothetical protein NST21_01745 [Peribacillus sp. FSL K6-1552]|uniref:hypothetical protein n=1 Tax=Peribacillus sp. FSL K6-1552 TaxID=2954514 RepID=UPI0030FA118F